VLKLPQVQSPNATSNGRKGLGEQSSWPADAQRGMTFLILTYIFVIVAKKLNFYGEKKKKIVLIKLTKTMYGRQRIPVHLSTL